MLTMSTNEQDVSFSTITLGGRWLLSQCSRCGALVVPPARGAAESEGQRLHITHHQQERTKQAPDRHG
jgi:uncharacterized OB-fold protein